MPEAVLIRVRTQQIFIEQIIRQPRHKAEAAQKSHSPVQVFFRTPKTRSDYIDNVAGTQGETRGQFGAFIV